MLKKEQKGDIKHTCLLLVSLVILEVQVQYDIEVGALDLSAYQLPSIPFSYKKREKGSADLC